MTLISAEISTAFLWTATPIQTEGLHENRHNEIASPNPQLTLRKKKGIQPKQAIAQNKYVQTMTGAVSPKRKKEKEIIVPTNTWATWQDKKLLAKFPKHRNPKPNCM